MDTKQFLTVNSFWTFVAGFVVGILVIMATFIAGSFNSQMIKTNVIDSKSYSEAQLRFIQNPSKPYSIIKNRDGTYNLRHSSGDYKLKSNAAGKYNVFPTTQGGYEMFPTTQGGYEMFPTPQGG